MSNDSSSLRQRRGRRAKKSESDTPSSLLSAVGGQVRLLADSDLERIHEAALSILEETGIAEAPPLIVDMVTAAGGEVTP
ncbi:MAG: trimethylamine methyltransferase family protein, partial [Pseudomonadota bacterium]|nr:trimethylamine methyltransferase family protein [Pseudomonadota bacterium]